MWGSPDLTDSDHRPYAPTPSARPPFGSACANLIAALVWLGVIAGMGAKYQPTVRDLKASERFRNKQVSRPMLTKKSSDQPMKKEKKSS